jgi:hypothetical protein
MNEAGISAELWQGADDERYLANFEWKSEVILRGFVASCANRPKAEWKAISPKYMTA